VREVLHGHRPGTGWQCEPPLEQPVWDLEPADRCAVPAMREPTLRLLGDAVYREDEPLVQTLLERIREIDGELEKREEARAETLAAARRHVDEERGAARATQRFVVEQASDETSDE